MWHSRHYLTPENTVLVYAIVHIGIHVVRPPIQTVLKQQNDQVNSFVLIFTYFSGLLWYWRQRAGRRKAKPSENGNTLVLNAYLPSTPYVEG